MMVRRHALLIEAAVDRLKKRVSYAWCVWRDVDVQPRALGEVMRTTDTLWCVPAVPERAPLRLVWRGSPCFGVYYSDKPNLRKGMGPSCG